MTVAALAILVMIAGCSQQPRHPEPRIENGNVVVEIARLPLSEPQFFTHRTKSKNVSFFVLRLPSGIQSYFDACISCYPKRLGYVFHDRRLVCRACNTTYSVYKLDQGIGGCYPIRISGTIDGGNYLIPVALLDTAADKF